MDFVEIGICAFVYENMDYKADGSRDNKYIKCKFGDDDDMKKVQGVLHKYAELCLPFTHFEGMPATINEKWTIVNNHRDDLMKMTN